MESAEAMTKLFSLEKSLSEPVRKRTRAVERQGGSPSLAWPGGCLHRGSITTSKIKNFSYRFGI